MMSTAPTRTHEQARELLADLRTHYSTLQRHQKEQIRGALLGRCQHGYWRSSCTLCPPQPGDVLYDDWCRLQRGEAAPHRKIHG